METSTITLIRPVVSEKEFLQQLVEIFHKNNFAEEAVECLDPSKLSLKYLTGYQYKGVADCGYACQTAADLEITINDKKSKISSGTPLSGAMNDVEFNIAVPDLASDTRPWVKAMAGRLRYTTYADTVEVPDVNSVKEEVVGSYSVNPLDYWVKNSNEILDELFKKPAYAMASNSVLAYENLGIIDSNTAAQMISMGASGTIAITNLTVKTRNNLKEYGHKVLIPCYVLEFQYQGNDLYIAACACDKTLPYTLGIPRCKPAEISAEEQAKLEMPEKAKTLKLVSWGWIVAVGVVFLNFIAALVCLGIWFGAKWYLGKDIKARAREIEANRAAASDNLRNKLAKQLGV